MTMLVSVLYRIPRLDEGANDLPDMIFNDEGRISHALNKPDIPVNPFAGTDLIHIEATGLGNTVDIAPDYKLRIIPQRVDYTIEDN